MTTEEVENPGCQCCSCCCEWYPQGPAVVFPQLLSLVAFIASTIALASDQFICATAHVMVTDDYDSQQHEYDETHCQGLRITEDEYYYEEENVTPALQAATAFGITSTILGFFVMVGIFSATCLTIKHKWKNLLSICFIACFVFDGLTFVAFASEPCDLFQSSGRYYDSDRTYDCTSTSIKFGGGAVAVIVAMIFWLLSAVTILVLLRGEEAPAETALATTPPPSGVVLEQGVKGDTPVVPQQDAESAPPAEKENVGMPVLEEPEMEQ